jgi:polysaccharide export outer membrane protein
MLCKQPLKFARKPGRLAALALSVALLNGCAFAPGSYIATNHSAEVTDVLVQFHSINMALINQLASQQQQLQNLLTNPSEQLLANYDYRVGRGDILNITVWEHPELTIPAGSNRSAQEAGNWVHSDGTIFYPYIGKVKVEGLKLAEIRDLIAERLGKFIEKPQVDVTVAAFRSQKVYVTGEIAKPGTLPVTNVPLTLIEAISSAGGITEFANWEQVTLSRGGAKQSFNLRELYQDGNANQNIVLQHDDVLHIARNDSNKVFVLGEVRQPKSYMIGRSGMTLAEALADAGGLFEQTANASGIFVIRQADPASGLAADVYQLHAKSATALVMAEQFRLQERDIVYVTAAPIARWNRVISQLLPSITGLYSIGRFQNDISN